MTRRYNAFGPYLKKQFGTIVYKVNVDAGFTCPNRDGTLGVTGCIYCNNNSFRPSRCSPELSIKEQIRNGIRYLSGRYNAREFLVYFQPYTNTYASAPELEQLYKEALSEPGVIGLAIGTRPDCIDEEKIELLESLASDYFILIEYGLQSIYDKSLQYILRGHDYQTFLNAVNMTVGHNIHIGAHIIVGFPTETMDEMLSMADEISELPVEFLKIHQLQIIKDTVLAEQYMKEPFYTFRYEEYLDFLVDFIERLSPDIVLQRLFATAPDEILIAPKWGKTKQQIIHDIEERFIKRDAVQGSKCMCLRD
ncbi:TIGR01212 family radical SAM protein [Dissulfurispira thermophila]|uniref:TIGR01212 family radical SAM protein n=2 Tax=root TaxID=1 RepID=A0A7G1H0P3_9BACT|nr:TIGR01212 family radical SAM protein [Dissulfurispira thermophila]BCB95237.1 TIGR01212 family radical SAM protein [Dissulfurispira thermophila]